MIFVSIEWGYSLEVDWLTVRGGFKKGRAINIILLAYKEKRQSGEVERKGRVLTFGR